MFPDSQSETKGSILLIDDMPENLQLLNDLLVQLNYTVRCATNGIAAIKTCKIKSPDVIFLDIKMPEMDGYQVCEALKADPVLCEIPIIFISHLDDTFDKVRAFQAGGADYITKPFNVDEVVTRLNNQLTLQHQKSFLQQTISKHQQVEDILSQSRSLLSSVLNSSLDGIASLESIRDPQTGNIENFRCLVVNPVISKALGKQQEDFSDPVLVKEYLDAIAPHLFDHFVQVVETGESIEEDIYYPLEKSCWYHFVAVKLGDGVAITVRDITTRKLAEQELRRYERIVSATTDGISLIDHHYRYKVVNQTYLNWFCRARSKIIGHFVWELFSWELFETRLKPCLDIGLSGEHTQYEAWFNFPDQIPRFLRVKYSPYIELDGSISGVVVNLHDLTDLKKIEMDLAAAKEIAETATKVKSEFLANMSHEIRTPMNGILGMAQLLQNTNLTEQQKGFIKTIKDSSNGLLMIINDILDLSKIESGMRSPEAKVFVLEDIVQLVYNLLHQEAIDKGIKLDYAIDGAVPEVIIADDRFLRQILLNLTGNAVKFTEKGYVLIEVQAQFLSNSNHCELIFAVHDTGIGIDRDRLIDIFEPFTQADSSINRNYGGTGLGLSICKNLVALMGGKIWVESLGYICREVQGKWDCSSTNSTVKQGTTFYFSMTIAVVAASETAEKQANPELIIDPDMAKQYPLKILLAEDNLMNQEVVSCILDMLGYSVDIANNGLEVLEILKKQSYDVVFMDMQMPKMDGLTASKHIRQNLTDQPQIVAMTANILPEHIESYLVAGINNTISKPLEMETLIKVLIQCFQKL